MRLGKSKRGTGRTVQIVASCFFFAPRDLPDAMIETGSGRHLTGAANAAAGFFPFDG